jgi:nucleoside-diphosphate-sugar epimerase
VHGISRRKPSEDNKEISWWEGDIADINIVRRILSEIKPDIIFHLASHVAGARDLELVLPTFHSNLTGTVNILTVATELDCKRIIITGSLEEPDQEEAGAIPCSPYAAAKWAGSAYARMFHALYKTPVVLARLFMVYGPGQQDVHKLIPYVTLSALRQEAPKLSSGQRLVDWIYVEDVVDGLLSMAQAPDVEGRSIEIGSGVLVSVGTVAQEIVHIINPDIKPVFGHIPERPMEQERVANAEVTYAAIGWKAATSLNEGLQNTVQWYREFSNNIDRAGA